MCGRFVAASPPGDLAQYFGAMAPDEQLLEREPQFNIAPSASVLAVLERALPGEDQSDDNPAGPVRRIEELHWGLLPIWAKDKKIGNKMFNARSETLATKGAFKSAFAKRRCLIPVDGFYEWQVLEAEDEAEDKEEGDSKKKAKPRKQPVFIHRVDGDPFAFAGIWETWRGPERNDEPLRSCSIITGEPNDKMAHYHNRMPVMLAPDVWDQWLDPAFNDLEALEQLFVPAPSELLEIYPVSSAVNNARNQGSQLADRLASAQ